MRDYKQHDVTDCGASCLAFVFDHHGLRMSISALRQKCGTNQSGTTALGLVETARICGFEAKGVRCRFEDLRTIPLPGIAHLVLGNSRQHFVVVCAVGRQHVQVMDPAVGRREKWSIDRFKASWTNVFVVLSPSSNFRPTGKSEGPWSRLFALLGPQKYILFQAFTGVVLTTVLSLASAIYIQKIVDNVIVEGNRNLLRLLGIAMLAILSARALVGYFQSILILRSAQRIDAGLVLGYYRHLMRLPQSFFDTMRVGEITSRIRDAVAVREFLNNTILNLILNPLILCVAGAAMFGYSWRLALFSIALVPANVALYLASDWLNRRYQREIMERTADFQSHFVESLHAMSVVRSCGLEDAMTFRTETRVVRLLKSVWSSAKAGSLIGTIGAFATQAYSVGLLWIGANLVLDSQLTAGELMSCNALAGYITGPIIGLIGMNTSIRSATTATERLYEILDLELEKDEGNAELTLQGPFEIKIEQVHFQYPGRLATLADLSVSFPSGMITALSGPSGCGKSTLLGLLQRHYLPGGGKVLIGEVDHRYVKLGSLRRSISYVPQRIDLLAGTVLDNIAPGDPNPDLPRIVELCREVGILGFVETLPRGFHTLITENGANLSGGQKQRLAIVRCLYADAPIILMDEPSSALDAECETMLSQKLTELRRKGRLIILAVHNRRLLALCDRVVELAHGRVASISGPLNDSASTGSVAKADPIPPPLRMVDENATETTKAVFFNLYKRTAGAILFGQTDANIMGVDENGRGWFLETGRCDIKDVTGQWPAVYGFDVPELTNGWQASCGFLPVRILDAFARRGLITVVWHPENFATAGDRWKGTGVMDVLPGGSHHEMLCRSLGLIADHLGNLKDARGRSVPIIFRCWSQQNAEHFWWGRSRCTPDEYIRLY